MRVSRRSLLRYGGTVTLAGLAGCGFGDCGAFADLRLTRATNEAIAGRFADPVTTTRLGPYGAEIAVAAINNGTQRYGADTTQFADGRYTHGGEFYELTTTSVATRSAIGFPIRVEFSGSATQTPDASSVIPFAELPGVDQHAVMTGFLNAWARKLRFGERNITGSASAEFTLRYANDADVQASALVPESEYQYIAYEGQPIRFSVEGSAEDVQYETFEVDARLLAETRHAFVNHVKDAVLAEPINLDNRELTDQQAEILDEAIAAESGYEACIGSEDDPKNPELVELVRLIFDPEENARHFVPDLPRLVVYEATEYLADYSVAIE